MVAQALGRYQAHHVIVARAGDFRWETLNILSVSATGTYGGTLAVKST